jgi:hypothetical protein
VGETGFPPLELESCVIGPEPGNVRAGCSTGQSGYVAYEFRRIRLRLYRPVQKLFTQMKKSKLKRNRDFLFEAK